MALVLCTGVDRAVMETRKLILEAAGHAVVVVMDEPSLLDACNKHQFDVVVIGQTLASKMKRHIAEIVKANCSGVKILELYQVHTDKVVKDADSWLLMPNDLPQEFATRVTELADQKRKAAEV